MYNIRFSPTCPRRRIRTKIKGAVEYCKAKKLTKQCPYEKKTKYLVLTSDKVENLACHSPFFKIKQKKKYIYIYIYQIFCHGHSVLQWQVKTKAVHVLTPFSSIKCI